MIGGANGATPGWQYAMVLLGIVLFVLACVGPTLFVKDNWRRSKTLKLMLLGIPIVLGLFAWYRIDSNDMWVAHAHMNEGIDLFIETPGAPEIISISADRIPTIWWPDRPQHNVPSCLTYPVRGSARIEIAGDDFDVHLREIEERLNDDGWDTIYTASDRSARLRGYLDDRSINFDARSFAHKATEVDLDVNSLCRDNDPALQTS